MLTRRRRRRQELQNIASLGDFNELSISGHVEHPPQLHEDEDGWQVWTFVLTHTTTRPGGWERQLYDVQAHNELGQHYAATWQPNRTTIIDGRLEHDVYQTLAGPVHSASIVAHRIDTTLGAHPHPRTNSQQRDG